MAHEKIVVVDDEIIVAKSIEATLINFGYEVPFVSMSGTEVIEKIQDYPTDLVLMDIKLTGEMDGIETANFLRKKYELPIIYLTAYADNDTLRRAKQTIPYGFLLKPVEDRELYAAIEVVLQRKKVEKELLNKLYLKKFQDISTLNKELEADLFELLKLSTKLIQNQQELEVNLKYESLLALIAIQLNIIHNLEDSLNDTLMLIARISNISKVNFYQFDNKNGKTKILGSNYLLTYKNYLENYDNSPDINMIRKCIEKIKQGEFVISSNLLELNSEERLFFKRQDIKSVLIVPVWINNQIEGFIYYGRDYEYKWDLLEIGVFRRMTNLISNTWERSRYNIPQTQFAKKNIVELKNIIKGTVWLVKDLIKKNGIKLDMKFCRKYLTVAGKSESYEQIFSNLIIHILKALKEIRKEGKKIKISTVKKGNIALIKIQDNTIKIPKVIKNRIFDSYFLSQKEITFFVGLPVIKNLINELGGYIKIRNAKSSGIIFTVGFPIAKEIIA